MISTIDAHLYTEARILPILADWSESVTRSWTFKTDVIASEDGGEQRRAVRAFPRQTLSFKAAGYGALRTPLDWYFDGWYPRPTYIIDPTRVASLQGLAKQQTQSSIRGERPAWIVNGMTVILTDGQVFETRRVTSYAWPQITFAEKSDYPFPKGARVFAALRGRPSDGPSRNALSSRVDQYDVSFDIDPAFDLTAPQAGTEFEGFREVFSANPDWGASITTKFTRERQTVDFDFGRTADYVLVNHVSRELTMDVYLGGYAGVKAGVDFFRRQRGRAGEFLLPLPGMDIPYSTMTGGSDYIVIDDAQYGLAFADSIMFKRVRIVLRDGTAYSLPVDNVTATNGVSTILLQKQLPQVDLNPSTVLRAQWECAARFATDRLDVEFMTTSSARTRFTFATLRNYET